MGALSANTFCLMILNWSYRKDWNHDMIGSLFLQPTTVSFNYIALTHYFIALKQGGQIEPLKKTKNTRI